VHANYETYCRTLKQDNDKAGIFRTIHELTLTPELRLKLWLRCRKIFVSGSKHRAVGQRLAVRQQKPQFQSRHASVRTPSAYIIHFLGNPSPAVLLQCLGACRAHNNPRCLVYRVDSIAQGGVNGSTRLLAVKTAGSPTTQ
jgi:hypothetical protein